MVNWHFLNVDYGEFYVTFDTVFIDDHYFDAFNSPQAEQESYWVSNARLGFRSEDERLNVALWVKNLADEEYTTLRLNLASTFNTTYNHRGRPRTYGLELSYSF